MKKIVIIISILFTLNASASDAWQCSNWINGISNILVYTGMRSTLMVMNKPTKNLAQAKMDLLKNERLVKNFKVKTLAPKTDHSLELKPIIVQKNNEYFVILNECLTAGEAASIHLEFLKNGDELSQVDIKGSGFQELPKEEEKATCHYSIFDSYVFKSLFK